MRIVIIATGSWGDVRPNAALGLALQKSGYAVVLVADQAFRGWVEERGLGFAGLSVDIQQMLADQHMGGGSPLQTIRMLRETTQTTIRMGCEIADVIREGDTVLLSEGMLPLLNGALEKKGARVILANLQPWAPTAAFSGMAPEPPGWLPFSKAAYNRWAGNFVRRSQWLAMSGSGNQIRAQHLGLSRQTWAKHRAMLEATPSLLLVSPHVLPRPSDWPAHQRVTGYIFDDDNGWQPPRDLLDFLERGSKPVYIGFGSMHERQPRQATRLFLDAVKQSGRRAILLSGWAGIGADDLPDGVFLLKYAPHNWLFPRVAAAVHHGGAGTTASALRAGVPSVVVPVMSDQPFWGRQVHALGAGARPIPRAKLTAENLAEAIIEVTTSGAMQERAAQLGEKISAEDGASAAVRTIREFLEER